MRSVTGPPHPDPRHATETTRPSRRIELARAAWGTALLVKPAPVMTLLRTHPDPAGIAVARILGARQLAQALLSGLRPGPDVLALGAWVDTLHACTALALACIDRRRLRVGVADAAVAGLWACAGLRDANADRRTAPEQQQRRDRLAAMVLRYAPGAGMLRAHSGILQRPATDL